VSTGGYYLRLMGKIVQTGGGFVVIGRRVF
jgi:hypothetical protein